MKTYIKPSIEVVETELEQMVSLSTTGTSADGSVECLDKGQSSWNDGSSYWGE
ncbi:MAG: hypothetical protein LUC44_08765 [Prevotellaceae bacterium]|nr:hypothetical protein [Prevotellaceae bacterium]